MFTLRDFRSGLISYPAADYHTGLSELAKQMFILGRQIFCPRRCVLKVRMVCSDSTNLQTQRRQNLPREQTGQDGLAGIYR